MRLLVQWTDKTLSSRAIIQHGLPKDGEHLSFFAYTDEMKARVLDAIAAGAPLRITKVTGEYHKLPRDNEFFAPLAPVVGGN